MVFGKILILKIIYNLQVEFEEYNASIVAVCMLLVYAKWYMSSFGNQYFYMIMDSKLL